MAKRTLKLNPTDVRGLGRDVDSIIHGSAPAIDAVYDEYDDADKAVANIEFFIESLQANNEPVTREMRARLVTSKKRVRDLDGRIAQYTKAMLRRLKKRMAIIRASPGAAFNKDEIRKVDGRILRVERKGDVRGYDVRPALTSLMGDVITLEQDSGITLRHPPARKSAAEVRKSKEASLYSKLVKVWKDTYKDAKDDPRVQEDVEWIQAQLHEMDRKFKRNETISHLGSMVTKRVGDLRRRIDSYKSPKTHRAAKKATGEFVVRVQEFAMGGTPTSKGVDKMQLELGGLSRQFRAKDRAEWSRADQRSFASDLSRIRKALERLRPKGGRKENPCIGLHFHGKDADDLLKSLEDSGERQQKSLKKNPAKISEKQFWKQIDALKWPKIRKKVQASGPSWDKENQRLLKKKPLAYWTEIGRMAHEKAADLVKRLNLGVNDFASDFSADIVGHGEVMYDRMMSDSEWAKKQLDSERYGLENFFYMFPRDKARDKRISAGDVSKEELSKAYRAAKAKKKSATPKGRAEVDRCRKLWDTYCEKPTKKNLRLVLAHLDKMKGSTIKAVKSERARCYRVANREANRLKMK